MYKGDIENGSERSLADEKNQDTLNNIKRSLTMLEKALKRVIRRNYFNESQYPEIIFLIEEILTRMHSWIDDYKAFSGTKSFSLLLGMSLKELGMMVGDLLEICEPVSGKRKIKKSRKSGGRDHLHRSINSMLGHVELYLSEMMGVDDGDMSDLMEEALAMAFERHCGQKHERREIFCVSSRGEKSYIFPWSDKDGYEPFVRDKKRFRREVVEKLAKYGHATGHRPGCKGAKGYHLIGFRSEDRKTIMEDGRKGIYPIRMVICLDCGQRFSLLPSFLPREKNFGIDVIGQVIRQMTLFGQSIRGAISSLWSAGVKSKQTVLNWLRWMGTLHPATILSRAGVTGSGYFQEDEGFEKEPDLRTYTVFMVESGSMLVWHVDYVDHVDAATLCESFEAFSDRITFNVLGVTKDKWKPSTKALKTVFKSVWIGYCHLHYLKKLNKALLDYQKETNCELKEVKRLYKKVHKVLENSTSKINMEVKLNALKDEAFQHPLLKGQLDELKKNAVHYTVNKNRKGITRSTSMVDNILKIVKRKLRQAESFRDREWARILFKALANVRNFVPFLSGAKNAHKSPFMLADGETHDLPWIQVMNMHNAFLFTKEAF